MLPNFLRAEQDGTKLPASLGAGENVPMFPARSMLTTPRTDARPSASFIGPDLTISGNLISKGEVQVDGNVEGDIHGSHVVVGESAVVAGGIIADEVVIRGHVVGSVRSKRVMLQATSQVEGDIYHQSLSIEQGAMFEGKSRRTSDDPRTIALPSAGTSYTLGSRPPELPN